jgi:Calx-beta domain/Right handed beta helix region/Domain of unknown function (DUF4214)
MRPTHHSNNSQKNIGNSNTGVPRTVRSFKRATLIFAVFVATAVLTVTAYMQQPVQPTVPPSDKVGFKGDVAINQDTIKEVVAEPAEAPSMPRTGDYSLPLPYSRPVEITPRQPVSPNAPLAGLTGTKNIPGDYATLALAITDLNTNGVGVGGVIFNVTAAQTAPAGGYVIGGAGSLVLTTSSAGNPITFIGNGNTITAFNPQTVGNINDGIIKLIGADFVTIQGFTIQENALNTVIATAGTNNATEFGVALFYVTTTDGAQNNTIQNNTITLNRAYANTFGIYSTTRTNSTAVTATAEATTAAGSNSNNKYYANNISNLNYAVVLISVSAAAAMDTGNDIGGTSAATGNTITNFATGTSALSGYSILTGSNYAIFENQQNNDNISFNTITSATPTNTTVTVGGILKNYSVGQPTGTITTTINNNTVTVTSAPTTGPLIGINNQGLTALSTATMSMNNNVVANCAITGASATTASLTGITNLSAPGTMNMTGNTVKGNSSTASTTGSFTGISNSGAVVTTLNITNNDIGIDSSGAVTFTGASTGQIIGVLNTGGAATATVNLNNNNIRGIVPGASAQVTGVTSQAASVGVAINIKDNHIGTATSNFITAGTATAGVMVGAFNSAGASTATLTITGNDIRGVVQNVTGSGAHIYFQNQTFTGSTNISNNTITNVTANTTGNVTMLGNSVTHAAGTTHQINNNSIVTAYNKTGAGGSILFYNAFGSSANTVTETNSGNNFSNMSFPTGASIIGWRSADGTTPGSKKSVTNNTFNNISGGTYAAGTAGVLYVGFSDNTAATNNVSDNIISNISANGTVTGIFSDGQNQNFFNNRINTLSSNGAAAVVTGISMSGATTQNIFRNKIYDLSASDAGATVNGILVSAGTTNNISNNLIGDLRAPAATSALDSIRGINLTSTTTSSAINVYYNSIYLNALLGGANFGTTGIFHTASSTSTTSTLNLRNNIIVNNSVANGTGLAVAYRRSAGAAGNLANYAAASNNNDFFAGTPSASRLIYSDGVSSAQTLNDYKTGVFTAGTIAPRDSASVTENPPFLSTTGSSASFLHLTTPAIVENAGAAIAGFTIDYDNDTRDASTPEIGADEITTLQFSSATYSVLENVGGGLATITVTRTPGTGNAATVNYATSDNSATGGATCTGGTDYVSTSGTLNFAAADTSKTFNVTICPDTTFESDETVNLSLNTPTGSILGTPNTAVLTITNDDPNDVTFNASGNLAAGTYNNITVNSPAVVTVTGNIVVNGCVNLNSGATLNMGTFTFTGSGCFTVNSGSTLGVGSAAGITTGATGNVQVSGTRTFSSGANYVYNGALNQAVGNALPGTVANLTIANTGGGGNNTVTGNSGQAVSGTLTVQSGVYSSASDYVDVVIAAAGTLSLAANITVSGNWTNDGTFTSNGFGVTFDGNANQSISGSSSTSFSALTISNTGGGGSNIVSLAQPISDTSLNVTSGVFDQGPSANVSSGAVSVSSGATWSNTGTGDLTLSGGVANSGSISFNGAGAGCPQSDDILIRSSVNGTQRAWSGLGTYSLTDVDVKDQAGTAIISVRSGANSGNNGLNWLFVAQCNAYVWSGAISTDWTNPLNWSPSRTAAATDILYFSAGTPSPIVTNVAGATGGNTETIAELHVDSGVTPTFSSGGANTLAINAGSGNTGFDVSNLAVAGANALTIRLASGTLGSVSGTMSLADGGHRLIGQAAGAISFGGVSVFSTQSGFTGNAFGDGSSAANGAPDSVRFKCDLSLNCAFYIQNAGGSPFGASGNPSVVTFESGTTARFLTASGFDANGRSYSNLQISDGSVAVNATDTGNGNFHFDNLEVNSTGATDSSLTYTGTGSAAITIGGAGIYSSGVGSGSSLANINLTAPGGFTLSYAGTMTIGTTETARAINLDGNVTVTNGTTVDLQRVMLLGIANPNTKTVTVNYSGALNGSSTGYVVGSLAKQFGGGSLITGQNFPIGTTNGYSPIDVTNATGTGSLTTSATATALSGFSGANKLARYWSLASSGVTQADLKFQYVAGDVVGTEANYKIFRKTGSDVFTQFNPTTLDTGNHFATLTGVTGFSDWTLAEPAALASGTISFLGAPYSDSETNADHTFNVTVQRTGGSDGAVDVSYNITDGTATTADNDYSVAAAAGTLHWNAGDATNRTLAITIKGDTTFEPNETINLSLSGASGATISGLNPTTLTITNDDPSACTPPSVVYVDDDWVGATLGTDPDGAGPATNFGCDSFATIQGGVTGVASGGAVNVAAGTYTENVTIAQPLTLTGAGAASVFVRPAISNPNCGGAGGGSICAGGSNIMLVQASNVTISGMTLDGDNPGLTSGEVFGGADIDARNGIITNHLMGTYNNLEVHHLTVKNIYLRGMYASSGGSFNFHDNTVDNVQASFASIGMFNFLGAGAFTNNNVSRCNDAIASNHSRGTTYTGNTVTTSASGIHSDNAGDSGGANDTISGNTVTNSQTFGYGIWVFVAYKTVHVQNNTVTNTDVGYAVFGDSGSTTSTRPSQAREIQTPGRTAPKSVNVSEAGSALQRPVAPKAPPSPPYAAQFTGNTVDGQNKLNSTGVYFTTSQIGFGSGNPKVAFTSNTVVNNTDGFYLEAETGFTLETATSFNRIVGNTNSQVTQASGAGFAGTLNGSMENNWWGCNAGPNNAGCGTVVGGGVDFNPWIVLGTSAAPNPIGPGGMTTVTADMTHNSDTLVPSVTDFVPAVGVGFSATQGTIMPPSGTITAGEALATFTSTGFLSGTATSTVDGQAASTNIVVVLPSFTIDDVTHNEGNGPGTTSYTFTITKTGSTTFNASVDYNTVDGTATSPSDFTAITTTNVVFLPAETTKQVTVLVNGDTTVEPNEAFTLHLSNPSGASIADADGTGTITNDDTCTPPATVYVDDDWVGSTPGTDPDGAGPATNFGCDSFATVQGGVTGVAASGTVMVAAGNYPEQVVISKSLTLTGAGAATTNITTPGTLTPGIGGNLIVVQIDNAAVVEMSNLTVKGPRVFNACSAAIFYGVYAAGGASLNLHDAAVNDIRLANPALYGCQDGIAIRAGSQALGQAATLMLNHMTITGYQKGAIVIDGTGTTGTVQNSTITGFGPENLAQNAIQIGRNAGGAATGNTITGNECTNPVCGPDPFTQAFGTGVLIFSTNATIQINNNTISSNDTGVYNNAPNTTISGNTMAGNRFNGIFLDEGTATITGNTLSGPMNNGVAVVSFTAADGTTGNSVGNMTQNTITGAANGVALLDSNTGDAFEPLLTAHFNRIISTTNAVARPSLNDKPSAEKSMRNAIRQDGAKIEGKLVAETAIRPSAPAASTNNLENNWWGCNAGPGNAGCGSVTGASLVDFDPWFVISGSATPSSINPGGTSTVAADMTKNSNGVVPAGTLPDLPIAFSATNGTMNPTSGTVTAGAASSLFTSTNGSSAVATLTVDNQNVNVPITVNAPSFSIDDVTHLEGSPSGTTSYVFTVTKTGATGLSAAVNFSTVNGTATLADNDYQANSGTLNFGPTDTTMTVMVLVNKDTTFEPDETFTVHLDTAVNATISDADGTGTITNDDCGPQSIVYVDDDWVGATPGADPDGAGPATNFGCDSFATIQGGINGVTTGGTVIVAAGSYLENPSISRAMTLKGAQFGVDARSRVASESLVRTNGNAVAVFSVTAANVTIDGFSIDGDDPGVTGQPLASGDDANVQYGVRPTGAGGNLNVSNNIIKKAFIGLRGDVAAQGNVVNQNSFDSIGNFDFGYCVSIRNNFYANVTNNKMTRAWTGVHINNHNGGGGPASFTISGNEIHSYAGGILYWLQFNGATGATINNNQMTAEAGAVANNFGVLMVSIQNAVNPTFTNNTVSGHNYGIGLFNVPTTSTITLGSTNSVSGSTLAGIFLTDNLNFNPVGLTNFLAGGPGAASTVNVTGMSISGTAGSGLKVEGQTNAQSIVATGSTITGVATGVALQGPAANVTAHFNRILGATNAITNANNVSSDLENNWWGCNAGPGNAGCGAVTGSGADFDPWIVLAVSASPASVSPGGSSTVTADMTKNSAGATPAGTVPNMPVSFSATNGTMFPTSGTITSGQAMSTFTSTNTSSGSACAMVDNQNTCANITVVAPSFSIDDVTMNEGNAGPTSFTFTITKTGAGAASVDYATVDGSATAPSDYTAIPTTTLSFLSADTTKQVTVFVNGDVFIESNEVFTVHLSSPVAATISDADGNGNITNDDVCGSFTTIYVDDDWVGATPGADPDGAGPATQFGCDSFAKIQEGVNAVPVNGTVIVNSGTYDEDVTINKDGVKVLGAGSATTNIRGPIGGPGSTVAIPANNVTLAGFTITRLGNTVADWNNPNLNSVGVSISSSFTNVLIRDNVFTGNRTGIDINNSSGHTVRNNVIDFNRTGMIFRNVTDNMTVVENFITNNWTVGVLFLDASVGSNVPPQTALNGIFSNNSISANWYGQIVDRQTGGSLPAPGANPKNFRGNWYGTTSPVVTTANTTEPGYSAQIPVAYGGTATPPGGQPDIAGPASANFIYKPFLQSGTDTNIETVPGRGTFGFQGVQNGDIIVRQTSLQGWNQQHSTCGAAGTGSQNFVVGPGTPPLGEGSLQFLIGSNGDSFETVRTADFNNKRIDALTTLAYNTYVTQDGSGGQAAYLLLSIDFNGDNTLDDQIFFEPVYQSAAFFPSNPQGPLVVGSWQQWDALHGGWWSLNNIAGAGPGTNVKSLTQYLAAQPNARILNTATGGFRIATGCGAGAWDNFNGNTDALSVGVTGANSRYDFEPLPRLTINDVTHSEGDAGTTDYTFTISLSRDTDQTVTVDYATANNTATEPSDYTALPTTTLTFNPGETTKMVTVQVKGDTDFEADETFFVNLSNVNANATIQDGQGVGAINNDDAQPSFAINDVTHMEGNAGTTIYTFTVTKSGNTLLPSAVNFTTQDGSATLADNDYQLNAGTLNFTATDTTQQITVLVNGDTTIEPDEAFNVHLSGAVNATITDADGTGTIQNDDSTTISGRVTYQSGSLGVRTVTMTLTGNNGFVTQTTMTDSNGDYAFTNVPVGNDYTLTPSKTGDVGSLHIESIDASNVARYVAGLDVPTAIQQIAGDADGDATLTSFDASLIARYVAGLPGTGIVGTWKFQPPSSSYPNLSSNQLNQNFAAILVGDTDGNWMPTVAPPQGEGKVRAGTPASPTVTVNVSMPHVPGAMGAVISIPVTVGDVTGQAVRAYDAQVTFNAAIVKPCVANECGGGPTEKPFDKTGTLSQDMTVTANTNNTGHLILSAFQTDDMIGSGTLINLRFHVVGAPGQNSPLTFEDYTDPNPTFHPGFRFNAGNPQAAAANGSVTVNGPTAGTSRLSGRVTNEAGEPVGGVTITVMGGPRAIRAITNRDGYWMVEGLETNDFYTVTPTRANYVFAPQQLSFSLLGDRTDAVFTGTANGTDEANPLESPEFFVRQQYLDFLGREPEQAGLDFWSGKLRSCGNNSECLRQRRLDVSAAFFISQEFSDSGLYLYDLYQGALGRRPDYIEYAADRRLVVGGPHLEADKAAFAAAFVERAEFTTQYPLTMSGEVYVDALLQRAGQTAGLDLNSQRARLLQLYETGTTVTESRSLVLRSVVEAEAFKQTQYNAGFVLSEYFSYLGRNPDRDGYAFWLNVLNSGDRNNYRGMVCSFVTSAEYQRRFATVIPRSNVECR